VGETYAAIWFEANRVIAYPLKSAQRPTKRRGKKDFGAQTLIETSTNPRFIEL
jgi:hypothetical protein